VRYSGKNALVWTSNAYAHSTKESAGVECVGGERRMRFETNLKSFPVKYACKGFP